MSSSSSPSYLSQWERYSSNLDITSFNKLSPVHHHILNALEGVIPFTILQLSRKHYVEVIPRTYHHTKFNATNTERFFNAISSPNDPGMVQLSDRQVKAMKNMRTVSFLDHPSMMEFTNRCITHHRSAQGDQLLEEVFSQVTHIHIGQALLITSGREWQLPEETESSITLATFFRCLDHYFTQCDLCFDVPEDTCAEEQANLPPGVVVTQEEHEKICHIKAYWDGIHAIFEVVEDLHNGPEGYIFHMPNDGGTLLRGVSNLVTFRGHHFLKSPIIVDLTKLDVDQMMVLPTSFGYDDLFTFTDHEGNTHDRDIHLIVPHGQVKAMAVFMAACARDEDGGVKVAIEPDGFMELISKIEERITCWEDEGEEGDWDCPCGVGKRQPTEEEDTVANEDD